MAALPGALATGEISDGDNKLRGLAHLIAFILVLVKV
jgi:hypothetical protein